MVKFYECSVCGKVVAVVRDGAGKTVCCGKEMIELIPGTVDASREKHVPFVTVEGKEAIVKVGAERHPMVEAHHIEWICLETDRSVQIRYLKPEAEPEARFLLDEGETAKRVYAYCNLHGLWSSEIQN